jgi:hypothetical protein
MFQVAEWPWQLIICLLDVLKCNNGEVDEAMFEGVERQCEEIFNILSIQKSDLDEVANVMFQLDEWYCEINICLLDV